jgi:hypothetical protein
MMPKFPKKEQELWQAGSAVAVFDIDEGGDVQRFFMARRECAR